MLLAIDIGSRHIHMVEGQFKNKQFEIVRYITENLQDNCLADGEIINEEAVVKKLDEMIKKNTIRTKNAVFTINAGSMISRKLTIPCVKKSEVVPVLQNEMDAVMNFSEPHIVDYTEMEETGEGTYDVETVAMPTRIVEQYMEICKKLKLKPVGLDLHQNVVCKFIVASSNIVDENIIVADLGNSYMSTYLFREGARVFSRRIFINTEQYEKTLVSLGKLENMNEEFRQLDLSPDELSKDAVLENTIAIYLSNITDQLQKMVQFNVSMTTKSPSSPISHIYLCGGMANMKGLTDYIQAYMDIPISSIADIVSPRVCKIENLPQYVNAIGALVRLD
ncbi:MAG: pilus assembly protein PilM [Cellulosilyticaceae bacterium]